MKVKRMVAIAGMFVVVGMGGVLPGCGEQQAGAGSGQDQAARNQFLAERQGTVTPGVGGLGGLALQGIFGSVEKVEGSKITVKNPMNNSTTVVELAEGGKVTKQVDGQASDIKVGDNVTAFGSKDGNDLKADAVSVGGDGLSAGGSPIRVERPLDGGSGGEGAPSAGGGFQPMGGQSQSGDMIDAGNMAEVVAGTVEKIEGSTLTVKTANGTATVLLGDSTKVQKQVEIELSDLKVGEMIMATGSPDGNSFKATTISVQNAMLGLGPGQPAP